MFLQLYIRAYARACKVETAAASDLNTFLTSWLSEMTEDEKAFLKFSQILHEWIPCPPLVSRDAAFAALGATPLLPENGDANGSGKETPPVSRIAQDGSGQCSRCSDSSPVLTLCLVDPVTVEASAETATKYFEGSGFLQSSPSFLTAPYPDAAARVKSLLEGGKLLWEVLHVATLSTLR